LVNKKAITRKGDKQASRKRKGEVKGQAKRGDSVKLVKKRRNGRIVKKGQEEKLAKQQAGEGREGETNKKVGPKLSL